MSLLKKKIVKLNSKNLSFFEIDFSNHFPIRRCMWFEPPGHHHETQKKPIPNSVRARKRALVVSLIEGAKTIQY